MLRHHQSPACRAAAVAAGAVTLLTAITMAPDARAQIADRPAGLSEQTAKVVPPVKMFDNLYYVGLDFVCAYVIKTSGGLILVDTLYNPFADHTIEAIKE